MSVLERSLPANHRKTVLKELRTEWDDLEKEYAWMPVNISR